MIYSPERLQQALREWLADKPWNHPFAVTLTLKQGRWVDGAAGRYWVPLTIDDAGHNLRHFLNVLNKKLLGSSCRRFGKKLTVVPVREGGRDKRLHYHLQIDCPDPDMVESFPSIVDETWRKTDWGYDEVCVKRCDSGWISYITKLWDKDDYGLSIDWLNCSVPKGAPQQ